MDLQEKNRRTLYYINVLFACSSNKIYPVWVLEIPHFSTWWKLYSQQMPNVKASLQYKFGEDLLFGKSSCKKKKCRSFLRSPECIKFFRLDGSHQEHWSRVYLIISTETPQVLCVSLLNYNSHWMPWCGVKVFRLTQYHLSNEEDSSLQGWRSAPGVSVKCYSFS